MAGHIENQAKVFARARPVAATLRVLINATYVWQASASYKRQLMLVGWRSIVVKCRLGVGKAAGNTSRLHMARLCGLTIRRRIAGGCGEYAPNTIARPSCRPCRLIGSSRTSTWP